jgi:hypothetical protein
MIKNTLTCKFIALLGIVLIASLAYAVPQTEKPVQSGKVYIVNLEQGQNFFSYVLRDVKSCAVDNLTFLCGIQLEDSWLAGKKILIPNGSVKSLYEFNSADEYRESMKQMQAAASKPPIK